CEKVRAERVEEGDRSSQQVSEDSGERFCADTDRTGRLRVVAALAVSDASGAERLNVPQQLHLLVRGRQLLNREVLLEFCDAAFGIGADTVLHEFRLVDRVDEDLRQRQQETVEFCLLVRRRYMERRPVVFVAGMRGQKERPAKAFLPCPVERYESCLVRVIGTRGI